MDKRQLSERDICTKFITPALEQAGWDIATQVREEFSLTKGRIIVRGKLHSRGESRRADFILYHQANLPIAVIEAKLKNSSAKSRSETPSSEFAVGRSNPSAFAVISRSMGKEVPASAAEPSGLSLSRARASRRRPRSRANIST